MNNTFRPPEVRSLDQVAVFFDKTPRSMPCLGFVSQVNGATLVIDVLEANRVRRYTSVRHWDDDMHNIRDGQDIPHDGCWMTMDEWRKVEDERLAKALAEKQRKDDQRREAIALEKRQAKAQAEKPEEPKSKKPVPAVST